MVKNMASSSFLNIAGYDVPCPKYGFQYVISTAVDSGRNLNNQVVGQKVGRDVVKLDQISWVGIDLDTAHKLLSIFDSDFFVDVTFENYLTGEPITRKMYVSDRTLKPLFVSDSTHQMTQIESLSFNLVDCGW